MQGAVRLNSHSLSVSHPQSTPCAEAPSSNATPIVGFVVGSRCSRGADLPERRLALASCARCITGSSIFSLQSLSFTDACAGVIAQCCSYGLRQLLQT